MLWNQFRQVAGELTYLLDRKREELRCEYEHKLQLLVDEKRRQELRLAAEYNAQRHPRWAPFIPRMKKILEEYERSKAMLLEEWQQRRELMLDEYDSQWKALADEFVSRGMKF